MADLKVRIIGTLNQDSTVKESNAAIKIIESKGKS